MKKKKVLRIILVVFAISIIGAGGFFGYKTFFGKTKGKTSDPVKGEEEPVIVKKIQIFDEDSKDRDVAVMINNNHAAWPHAGLQDSYLNYEIIVEGGITRIMAVFSGLDKVPEKVGSVRSARPYFLQYACENDAIYIHWGTSNRASYQMSEFMMDHLDGSYDGNYFYREALYDRAYEHTGFTRGSLIRQGVADNNFRTTSDNGSVFKYSADEIDLKDIEGAVKADYVGIEYSNYQTTKYDYDAENKVYKRSMTTGYGDTEAHTDAVTGNQYTTKNIITYKVENHSYDSYGRQELSNIGSGEGYFITNGYAIPITWEKSDRLVKTIYKYKHNGEEIKLNDGNTWVQIQPINMDLVITGDSL